MTIVTFTFDIHICSSFPFSLSTPPTCFLLEEGSLVPVLLKEAPLGFLRLTGILLQQQQQWQQQQQR